MQKTRIYEVLSFWGDISEEIDFWTVCIQDCYGVFARFCLPCVCVFFGLVFRFNWYLDSLDLIGIVIIVQQRYRVSKVKGFAGNGCFAALD